MSIEEKFNIIIPAKNELAGLNKVLPLLSGLYPGCEIIVVDDGSNDDTEQYCSSNGATVVRHHYSIGNGGAVKSGARKSNAG